MSTTRRHFLGAAAGIGLAAELQAQEQTRVSPNDRVQVALIGNGIQGNSDARSSLGVGGVEMVACADVYEGRGYTTQRGTHQLVLSSRTRRGSRR